MPNNSEDIEKLQGLSEDERKLALSILSELSTTGTSQQYNKLLYEDYEEIPVTIEEFLHNPSYLGKGLTDAEGRFTVFPYWVDTLKKLFPTNIDTAYNTLILSGAIGLGKSFVAVVSMLYMLYRMMCLKDPYIHFGLQPIDKITFSFINITLDAAKGVAWSKCQELLQSSSWFMSKGTMDSKDEPEWHPPKGIELICGSLPKHIIGRAVFCLDGNTIIKTIDGDKKLVDIVDKEIKVISIDNKGNSIISDTCKVEPTIKTDKEYEIELEDGSIVKCTENHKFLLTNGTYKEAKDLTIDDEIMEFNPYGYIYKTTNLIKSIKINTLDTPKQFYDVVEAAPLHNFLIKTNSNYIVSHNCSFEDEVSFQPNQDVDIQKKKAKELISSVDARMKSRFMKGEYLPTLNILASSKRTDQSFLESYIDTKKRNESKNTLVIDEPQWVIRTDKDSPNKFCVAVGNKFLNSEVLPLSVTEKDLQIYRDKGFSILKVPMGYYENFLDDIDIALTDIAGISTSNSTKYISGVKWAACKKDVFKNPFNKEILEVGNGEDDKAQYYDFFDLDKVDVNLKSRPLYMHLDMSVSGDKTGIAGVWIIGKAPTQEGIPDSKELYYKLAFAVSIKAPKGHQISFEKNRQFIYWLRDHGFNIKKITTDSFQAADMGQTLTAHGFNYEILSVDRVDKVDEHTYVCKPYNTLKNIIYEHRIEVFPTTLLTEEIINLERNNNGKIDHPMGGTVGCFTGDTKVRLVDGRSLSFTDLVKEYKNNKQNFVYSFNEQTQRIEPKPIKKAWCTLKNQPLVAITLDNGETIKCTLNHKFMLHNGEYCEAQALLPGDSLMSLSILHLVTVIEFLNEKADVYDIEVVDNHNFALDAGIFVHNSKDQADAVCGSVFSASQCAKEYAYDYGETLDNIEKVNTGGAESDKKQINIDFENELRKMGDPLAKINEQHKNDSFIDYGTGKAVPLTQSYIKDGIIVW